MHSSLTLYSLLRRWWPPFLSSHSPLQDQQHSCSHLYPVHSLLPNSSSLQHTGAPTSTLTQVSERGRDVGELLKTPSPVLRVTLVAENPSCTTQSGTQAPQGPGDESHTSLPASVGAIRSQPFPLLPTRGRASFLVTRVRSI